MSDKFKSPADALKAQGVDAKRGAGSTAVDVHDTWTPPKGDPLWHPRQNDPLNGDMLYDIAKFGVRKPILLARMGVQRDGKMRLALAYGCQRKNHLIEAVRRMKAGEPFRVFVNGVDTGETEVIPWVDGKQYIPVLFHPNNDIKSILLARAEEDSDPHKRAHVPSILAVSVAQLRAVHATDAEIIAAHATRGVDAGVLAALERWGELSDETKRRFDDGAPIGLLPSIVDLPREEQLAALEKYVAGGITTKMGVSRVKNREERAARGDLVEGIRRPVLRRILEVVRPTPADVQAAQETVEGSRSKGMSDAHDTLAAYYFDLGGRVMSGDMKALEEIPCEDLKRRLKLALKKEGKVPGKATGKGKKK
jgi:hypothetical protein